MSASNDGKKKQYMINIAMITTGAIGYMLAFLLRGSIAPIVDVLEHEYNATYSQMGFMSSGYWLTYFILQIPCGILIQYISPQIVYFCALSLFTLFSSSFGLPFIRDSVMLPTLIFMALGIASSPMALSLTSLIGIRLGNNSVANIWGSVQGISSLILFAGNIFQAWLYQEYQVWRPLFWAITILSTLIMVVFAVFNHFDVKSSHKLSILSQSDLDNDNQLQIIEVSVEYDDYDGHEEEEEQHSISPMTQDLPSPVAVETNTTSSHNHHTDKSETLLCGVKVYRERRNKTQSIKHELLRTMKMAMINPWNWLLGTHYFCANCIKLSFNGLWLISYMSLKFGYSRQLSTFICTLTFIADAVSSIVIGKLAAKYKKRKIFFILFGVCLMSPIYIIYCSHNANMYVIIACNIMAGIGTGVSPISFALVREYNEFYECADVAAGLFNTISCSAGFLCQWLIGFVMDQGWESGNGQFDEYGARKYTINDFDNGFIIIPICGIIYFVIGMIVKETNAKNVQWDESKRYFAKFFC